MKKPFIGVYNPSIILTYTSVFCSLYGMGLLLTFNPIYSGDPLPISIILLVIAGICDMFDGRVARLCKRTDKEKEFGIQLDSLADTVSFVVFPAVILMHVVDFHFASILISMLYVFAGIMRLGWFNVTTEENKGCYQGLPVTFAALIFPALYLITRRFDVTVSVALYGATYLVVAILFILNFKLKKPGLKFSILMLGLAVITVIGLLIF